MIRVMTFEPENKVEEILMTAATAPSARYDFYKELVGSNIYTIQYGSEIDTNEGVLKEGSSIQLLNIEINQKLYIPIFTSLRRLQEAIDQVVNYCSMNAVDFFQLTRGADVFLNPTSRYGKEFTAEEIESILNGSIFSPSQQYEVQKETEVMIGQPAIMPKELLDAISELFADMKEVKLAYHAHFFNPQMDEKPHTLIALEVSDNMNEIVAKAGMVANSVHVPDPPVTFIQLDGSSGLEDYFKSNVKPFYKMLC
ncbi:enhanced serine sensitivity protein SseB C-terminal domain-containing protein [Paenibacillus motobuensis]|nr:enhanced serine sensitivity protein SseB C-terminal domain-containing protein [Paenibacillus lutimineralis]MCM3645222.1 enhanced serine sensitivity protein SseB C-terminal domain-containing protein [Paenibacillus motobuensis]